MAVDAEKAANAAAVAAQRAKEEEERAKIKAAIDEKKIAAEQA